MKKWLKNNCQSLKGKKIAVTGTTGGIGRPLCKYLASLGAILFLTDRNKEKSLLFAQELKSQFSAEVYHITADLSDIESVKRAVKKLKKEQIDIFIHNAGAYSIPRYKTEIGFDNVFQINFISPYYMVRELKNDIEERNGKFVVVSSIAHRYNKIDETDIDFSSKKASCLVYGNAKRFLMFSLYELFKGTRFLSVVHPGITFTNITNHYPKVIFSIIKYPMKIIFMKPSKAAFSVLKGVFTETKYHYWIGPSFFDIWGEPKLRKVKISIIESEKIGRIAETIYEKLNNN